MKPKLSPWIEEMIKLIDEEYDNPELLEGKEWGCE